MIHTKNSPMYKFLINIKIFRYSKCKPTTDLAQTIYSLLRNNYLLKNQGHICARVCDVAEYVTGKWLAM